MDAPQQKSGLFGLFSKKEEPKVDIRSLVKSDEQGLEVEKFVKLRASIDLIEEELSEVWVELDAIKKQKPMAAAAEASKADNESAKLKEELNLLRQEVGRLKAESLESRNVHSQLTDFKSKLESLPGGGLSSADSQFMKAEVGQIWSELNKLSSEISKSKAEHKEGEPDLVPVQQELDRTAHIVDELRAAVEEERIFSRNYINRDEIGSLEKNFLKAAEFKKFIEFYNNQLDNLAHKHDISAVNNSIEFLLDWNKKFVGSVDQHTTELKNLMNLLIETNKQLKDQEANIVLMNRRLLRLERTLNARTVIE